ncbi:MAG: nucleotidyltransferase domain-containing protein [Candidatus Micrarchaeota archaeon]
MRFWKAGEGIIGSPQKLRLFRLLMRYPTKLFSGREAARLAGLSAPGAWRILRQFESEGIVMRRRIGKTDAWQLQSKHYLATQLKPVAEAGKSAENKLKRVILSHLDGSKVNKMILFGSTAREDSRPNSDIDILVVVPLAKDKAKATNALLDASVEVAEFFGNALSPIVYSEAELHRKRGLPLLKNIAAEGKVLYEKR